MKKRIFAAPIFSAIALVLELLPHGILMLFANPEGEPHRVYCSYFDLLPFGYADFAPLLTSLSTCIALILAIVCIITKKRKTFVAFLVSSLLALAFSLFITLSFYRATLINVFVSIALLVNSMIALLLFKASKGGSL